MAMMTYFYERNWSNLKKKKRNKCADSWLFFSINIFFQQKKCNIDPKEFNVFHHLSECVLYIQLDFLMVSRAKHYYSLNLRTSDRRTKNVFIRETINVIFHTSKILSHDGNESYIYVPTHIYVFGFFLLN